MLDWTTEYQKIFDLRSTTQRILDAISHIPGRGEQVFGRVIWVLLVVSYPQARQEHDGCLCVRAGCTGVGCEGVMALDQGWVKASDGTWSCGLLVPIGRVKEQLEEPSGNIFHQTVTSHFNNSCRGERSACLSVQAAQEVAGSPVSVRCVCKRVHAFGCMLFKTSDTVEQIGAGTSSFVSVPARRARACASARSPKS